MLRKWRYVVKDGVSPDSWQRFAPRTPCIGSFGAGAGKCSPPRTPCMCSFCVCEGTGRTSMPGIASFVYSTIGIAYEKLWIFNKAIEHHRQHLAIAKEMGSWPTGGEGKAYANLGIAYQREHRQRV